MWLRKKCQTNKSDIAIHIYNVQAGNINIMSKNSSDIILNQNDKVGNFDQAPARREQISEKRLMWGS